jgi:hypothetical protein
MIKYNIEQGSEAWFSARCGRVTGTRFKALLMKPSTQGYKDLVGDMVCELITLRMEETYQNAAMEHGIEQEPFARKAYEKLFETDVEEIGFVIPDEGHKYHEWIGVSPDGLTDGLLEIKCPKMKTHLRYITANKLPSEYIPQVQGQLFVTGLPYCDFMSFVEGMKPFVIRVYPDPLMFKAFELILDDTIALVKEELEAYVKFDAFDEITTENS